MSAGDWSSGAQVEGPRGVRSGAQALLVVATGLCVLALLVVGLAVGSVLLVERWDERRDAADPVGAARRFLERRVRVAESMAALDEGELPEALVVLGTWPGAGSRHPEPDPWDAAYVADELPGGDLFLRSLGPDGAREEGEEGDAVVLLLLRPLALRLSVAGGRALAELDGDELAVDGELGPALEAAREQRGTERLAVLRGHGDPPREVDEEIDRIVREAGWSRVERSVSRKEIPGRESR